MIVLDHAALGCSGSSVVAESHGAPALVAGFPGSQFLGMILQFLPFKRSTTIIRVRTAASPNEDGPMGTSWKTRRGRIFSRSAQCPNESSGRQRGPRIARVGGEKKRGFKREGS